MCLVQFTNTPKMSGEMIPSSGAFPVHCVLYVFPHHRQYGTLRFG